jgi:hypothetical protein
MLLSGRRRSHDWLSYTEIGAALGDAPEGGRGPIGLDFDALRTGAPDLPTRPASANSSTQATKTVALSARSVDHPRLLIGGR